MASKKYAPGARTAVERGIPAKVVNAIVSVLGTDEHDITLDANLETDLHASDLDVVEMGDQLGAEDECLDWVTVRDVVAGSKHAA